MGLFDFLKNIPTLNEIGGGFGRIADNPPQAR